MLNSLIYTVMYRFVSCAKSLQKLQVQVTVYVIIIELFLMFVLYFISCFLSWTILT